jgi:hypothetical protein
MLCSVHCFSVDVGIRATFPTRLAGSDAELKSPPRLGNALERYPNDLKLRLKFKLIQDMSKIDTVFRTPRPWSFGIWKPFGCRSRPIFNPQILG